jgi:two-component system OmpR family sensor kinase
MRLDEFSKARLKITVIISLISTIIISAFGGTVYYFYKEQTVLEISDELKSIAFEIARKIENSKFDWMVINNIDLPENTYVCIYNYSTGMLFYKKKMCDFNETFTGFKVIDNDVIFGMKITKNFDHYHIYVGRSLIPVMVNLNKLKLILLYSVFAVSGLILVFSYIISKKILKPIKLAMDKQEEFIQNISHDLKTPISVINSNLYLMKQKNFQNIDRNLNAIEKNINYMKHIISDMLFSAKIGTGKKEKINLNSVIKQLLDEFSPHLKEKNIKLKLIENTQISININYEDLRKLLSNLIENAIKYNHKDGFIEITINKGELSIKNSGEIIKEEEKEKIFERFYRGDTSRSSKGTGLGLSIVNEIASYYGLKIKLNTTKYYNEFIIKL